ncbi:class D sortase [Clostridium grantii]|uniref:Sortase A n=1 Tax=Clostridium grantii DSM 8605 TaxID=1121316 RepID=A0A1M5XV19_9CLOT|nr:class D sortase [Clostridium grantii]SHI03388.1 sortase A [Clostridium grantii DSM 8605]
MKKKKNSIIGIILIFLGISIISIALYMRITSSLEQKAMIKDFQAELNTIQDSINSSEDQVIEDEVVENVEETPEKKPEISLNSKAIGIMSIPKIELEVAIGEGVDMNTLKYALGHFPNTPMPGVTGNFAVAGHRSYTYNKYFNRLDELEIGDEINVTTLDGDFTYKVDNISIVEPEEVSVLNSTTNSTITLVTCTPVRVATHRLIIKGTLVN